LRSFKLRPFDLEEFRVTPLASAANFGPPTFLYLMQCEHFIKVGIAVDTQARRAELQRSNPFPIRILYRRQIEAKAFAMIAERGVHRRLCEWQHAGEWFTATPAQAREAIAMVCNEMPALIARHKELDRERRLARLEREAKGGRRKMYTADEEAAWLQKRDGIMAELFPAPDVTQASACSR